MTGTLTELDKRREVWRKDVLAFCRDVLYWRTGRGVEKWEPYPAQARAMKRAAERDRQGRPRRKTVAFCWPKRQGKSTATAALLAHSLVTGSGAHSVVSSNSRENAQTVTFAALLNFIRNSPILAALVPETERQTTVIACPTWDNWVRALPARVETVQGIAVTGYAVFDDAHSAPLDVLDMVASQTESPFAQILVPSMMGSTRGYVHRLWETSKRRDGGHILFDYWTDNRNPHVSKDWLARRKAELPPQVFAVLHENAAGEGADALFEADQLAACRELWVPPTTPEEWHRFCRDCLQVWPDEVRLGAGLDRSLGRGDDTVFAVVARYADKAGADHYAAVRCVAIRDSTEEQILAAAEDARRVFGRINKAVAEVYQMADLVKKWGRLLGGRYELENASGPAQAAAFNELWQLVNEGRFHYPAAMEKLHEQLTAFQIDTNSGRLPRFTGGSGKAVDDYVYATCWARVAASKACGNARVVYL